MRAVLDPNVIVSATLSRGGAPATVLRLWLRGSFELVVSPSLLAELTRVFEYPKIRHRVSAADSAELLGLIRAHAQPTPDPTGSPTVPSRDPGDDYLLVLAESARAVIVSGDADLLVLADQLPVYSPTAFLALLDEAGPGH